MRRVSAVLVGALLLGTGCSWRQLPFVRDANGMSRGATLDSLQQELAYFATHFAGTVSAASEDIGDSSTDRRIRRNALLWRLRMIPAIQRSAYQEDPRAGYVRALFVAIAQRQYFESGDGRTLFGDQQQIAIDAARRLESDAEAVGTQFLTQTELRRVVAEATELAQRHPIVGRDFSLQRASVAQRELQQNDVFTSVLSIPLSPFRALEGVDSGAQAIRDFNTTARHFTGIVGQLPEQIRGELELFLYDVEDRETVARAVTAMEQVGTSADRLTAVAEALPDELQNNFGGVNGVIEQAKQAVAQVESAVAQMQQLVGPLDAAAEKLRDGSLAWREVIGSRAERESDNDGDGRPFDIREWESTALAIGSAAGELRGLASDTETLSSGAVAQTLDQAIDRAFWRGAALIVLFFALLLLYRILTAFLPRRSGS